MGVNCIFYIKLFFCLLVSKIFQCKVCYFIVIRKMPVKFNNKTLNKNEKIILSILTNKNKINFIGPPGSGKTTISINLSNFLKTDLVILDKFLFNEKCQRNSQQLDHFTRILKNNNKYFIDGTYISILTKERIQLTDHFVMIEVNLLSSLYRIIKRSITKNELNCGEKFSFKLLKYFITYHLYKKKELIKLIPSSKLTIIKYEKLIRLGNFLLQNGV